MNKMNIVALVLLALALPVLSFGAQVTGTTSNADCDGWSLCTTVFFDSPTDQGSLAYTITIIPGDGSDVIVFGDTLDVTHPTDQGSHEFCFGDVWDSEFFVANSTVAIYCALDGLNPTVSSYVLECAVDAEESSFGRVKALFR